MTASVGGGKWEVGGGDCPQAGSRDPAYGPASGLETSHLSLTIDGRPVQVPAGSTVLEAARTIGVEIPTLCQWPGLEAPTTCLVCVVGIDGGERLRPACATRVAAGMTVDSSGPAVTEARRTALELLLARHAGDCLAPCEVACPTGHDAPALLRRAAAGDDAGAFAAFANATALPGVLAHLCPAPCERGCRRAQADGAVAVRACELRLVEADRRNPWQPPAVAASGRRVAVVGAGPAGLASAWHLARRGHAVEVLHRGDAPGGSLRRLSGPPAAALAADLDRLRAAGVRFASRTIDGAAALNLLRASCDAVVVACPWPEKIPGDVAAVAGCDRQRTVVQAIGAGKAAAEALHATIARTAPPARTWSIHLGAAVKAQLPALLALGGPPLAPAGDADAARCLACACLAREDCQLRRWAAAYGADPRRFRAEIPPPARDDSHPLISYEPGKCIACGRCVQIAARAGDRPGLAFIGRGLAQRVAVPFGAPLREALPTAALACADACPSGALFRRPGPPCSPSTP